MEGKNKKTKVFKWAAVLMLAAMMIVGCKQAQGNSSSEGNKKPDTPAAAEKYAVTFGAGEHGTLKAKADGVTETDKSPISVEKDKTVTFTATANTGYVVDKWSISGSSFESGSGADGSTTSKVKVTDNTTVQVTFKGTVAPPSPIPEGFVKITLPATGIVGIDPTYSLPGTDDFWKGVFRAGRKVKLSSYLMGKTEVTYKLWKEVYEWAVKPENGYKFANEGQKGSSGIGSEEEPVTMVSWRDCIVWCNAYTQKTKGEADCVYRKSDDHTTVLKDAKKTDECDKAYADMSKKGYRLPTEAEWEYAARWQGSNSTNAVQYGEVWLTKLNSASGAKNKWDTVETGLVAWYTGNSGSKTHSVGEKRANALGLSDMSGNVWEWCFDGYGSIEPGDVTDPTGAASGLNRVIRGGSWDFGAEYCVVGGRNDSSPDDLNDRLGFRLACRP